MRGDLRNPYGIMAAVTAFFAYAHICAGAALDVRAHGATGDGVASDTPTIQKSADAADGCLGRGRAPHRRNKSVVSLFAGDGIQRQAEQDAYILRAENIAQ